MKKLFRKAMEIAKRDPARTAEFISDVLCVVGVAILAALALVIMCGGV